MIKKHIEDLAFHTFHAKNVDYATLPHNYRSQLAKQSLSLFSREAGLRLFPLGTGFSISPHFLLTNAHVVRDQPTFVSRFCELSVLDIENDFDIALCYSKKQLPYTQYYFTKHINIDEKVQLLGKTKQYNSKGEITHQTLNPYSLYGNQFSIPEYFDVSQKQKIEGFSAIGSYASKNGSSGSPLINTSGHIIGLHRARVNTAKMSDEEKEYIGEGRSVFLRFEYMQEFIKKYLVKQSIVD